MHTLKQAILQMIQRTRHMRRTTLVLCILSGLVVVSGIGAFLITNTQTNDGVIEQSLGDEASYKKDLAELETVSQDFAGIRGFFVQLAQEKGGAYAFEILKRAQLPPNTDLHLLGHAIGDELYKQADLPGMTYCTQDFRNACSHSVVIGALLANGLAVLDEVNDVCANAPGGLGAYTMCFHGFGHGVLAYTEYEIPDAIELCKKVGTAEHQYNEYHQCVGGMVMEMNQGVHDLDTWAAKKDKYLDPQDPLRICQADYMPDEPKYFCYTYITPYIFDAAGVDPVNPTDEAFAKAFTYCDDVAEDNLRRICYAGFGKEFIVLAQGRDIRDMNAMTNDSLQKAVNWCGLADTTEGEEACLLEMQNSLYWGGENDYQVSIRYCSLMEGGMQSLCFEHMFQNVSYYEQSVDTKKEICEAVPEQHTQTCRSRLLEG